MYIYKLSYIDTDGDTYEIYLTSWWQYTPVLFNDLVAEAVSSIVSTSPATNESSDIVVDVIDNMITLDYYNIGQIRKWLIKNKDFKEMEIQSNATLTDAAYVGNISKVDKYGINHPYQMTYMRIIKRLVADGKLIAGE